MNMLTTEKLTMSSREIAELTNKRHDNVLVTIRSLSDNNILSPEIQELKTEYRGRMIPYFELDKRNSLIVVARLSPEFTAAVIDRWQELESNQAPSLPQTFAEALQLAADQAKLIEEQSQELQIAKPKAEFVDRFCVSEGNKTFREVAKILKANEREFRAFLADNKIMYKLGRGWTAYQNHIDAKRFHVSTGVADNEHAFTSCKFTSKGIEYVAGKWMARDL